MRESNLGDVYRHSKEERASVSSMSRTALGTIAVQTKPHEPPYLPTSAAERKAIPIWSGVIQYFPDALIAVAKVSKAGNDQHNPGQPLHWSRGKSDDHHDTLVRHLFDSGTVDTDGHLHSAKAAWRALAILQLEIEAARKASKE